MLRGSGTNLRSLPVIQNLTAIDRQIIITGAAPVGGVFGGSLPARLATSQGNGGTIYISPSGNDTTGTGTIGNPYRTPHKAFSVVNLTGGLILCRGGTYNLAGTGVSGTGQQQYNRVGSISNPPQIMAYPGETPIFTNAMFLVGTSTSTQGLRIGPGLIFKNGVAEGWDLLRVERANGYVEIIGCEFGPTVVGSNGILITDVLDFNITQVQIWNSKFHDCGIPTSGHYHGIYFAEGDATCLIANCVFYDNAAYAAQLGPAARNMTITCCSAYENATNGYGGFTFWDEPNQSVFNWGTQGYGLIVSNFDYPYAYSSSGTTFPNPPYQLHDCLWFNGAAGVEPGFAVMSNIVNANPQYRNTATRDLRINAGSAAINLIQPSHYGKVPATDFFGNPRITADAGAFAKEA